MKRAIMLVMIFVTLLAIGGCYGGRGYDNGGEGDRGGERGGDRDHD
jgi:hypothetical protein